MADIPRYNIYGTTRGSRVLYCVKRSRRAQLKDRIETKRRASETWKCGRKWYAVKNDNESTSLLESHHFRLTVIRLVTLIFDHTWCICTSWWRVRQGRRISACRIHCANLLVILYRSAVVPMRHLHAMNTMHNTCNEQLTSFGRLCDIRTLHTSRMTRSSSVVITNK